MLLHLETSLDSKRYVAPPMYGANSQNLGEISRYPGDLGRFELRNLVTNTNSTTLGILIDKGAIPES